MRARTLVVGCTAFVVACASEPDAARLRIIRPDERVWTQALKPDGTPLGIRAVDLWGDARRTGHGTVAQLSAGLHEPLHRHSRAFRALVLSGTVRYQVDGSETPDLLPGTFIAIGAGVPHFAECWDRSPCEVLVQQDGALDLR